MGSTLDELTSCDHKDSFRGHDGGQPEQDSGDKNDAAACDDAEMQKLQVLLIGGVLIKSFSLEALQANFRHVSTRCLGIFMLFAGHLGIILLTFPRQKFDSANI